jgi:hypothetical protein
MSDVQVYNLFAGLTVLFLVFGGLVVYALRKQAADAESRRARETRANLRAARRAFKRA